MKIILFLFSLILTACPTVQQTTDNNPPPEQPNPENISPNSDELPSWKKSQTDWIRCECFAGSEPAWNNQLNKKVHVILVLKETIDGEVRLEKSYTQQDANNKCQKHIKQLIDFGDVNPVPQDQVKSENIQQCEKGKFENKFD